MIDHDLAERVTSIGRHNGLAAVGIASARPFDRALRIMLERRDAGLHGGMRFTYSDPHRSTDPVRSLPLARSVVVGALHYLRQDPGLTRPHGTSPQGGEDTRGNSARVARYSWSDHYETITTALGHIAEELVASGWSAVVRVDDNALVDKEAAVQAGLGWYGKNTLVLLPGAGSYFVLGSVITDAPLPFSTVPVNDGCGRCTRCMSACPTGALVAPGVLDARKCLAWLLEAPGQFPREHRSALGDRIYGCDDCQEACPINRVATRHRPGPLIEASDEPTVSLTGLLALCDDELLKRYGRWYIPKRQARFVRRNALVALGNVGNGLDPEVVHSLRGALASTDPIVRSHAVWACARLGLHGLLGAGLEGETDPHVLEELALAGAGTTP
ncbi:MAG: tRNA epoxyqueuosine(34) reductase QueG [Acidimicrobiales bacterium]